MSVSDILHMGNFFFRIESEDSALCSELSDLFVAAEDVPPEEVVHSLNIEDPSTISPRWQRDATARGDVNIIKLIIRRAIEHHGQLVWLDAATMVAHPGLVG